MEHTDGALLDRVRSGDSAAFESLVERYRDAVHRHVAAMLRDPGDAGDVTQEVFLRVWERADQWSGIGAVRSWLFRIATNVTLNHLRSVRRRREQPLRNVCATGGGSPEESGAHDVADDASTRPDEVVDQAEGAQLLRRLVEGLPVPLRDTVALSCDADADVEVVADRLGIPPGTVKSRLHYARKRLMREWKEAMREWLDL